VYEQTEGGRRVRKLLVEKIDCDEALIGQKTDRVPVGRGVGARSVPDDGIPPWVRLDDDGLVPPPVEFLAQCAHENIVRAAGAYVGHGFHGSRGIALCM